MPKTLDYYFEIDPKIKDLFLMKMLSMLDI